MESLQIVKSDATELWLKKSPVEFYQNCGNFEILKLLIGCHVERSEKSFSILIVTTTRCSSIPSCVDALDFDKSHTGALLSNGLNDLNVLNGWNFFQYKEPENE